MNVRLLTAQYLPCSEKEYHTGDCCTAGFRAALCRRWVNRYRFGRDRLSTDVRFPSNTDHQFWALGFVVTCQQATYAVQQIAAYSITSSAMASSPGGKLRPNA